jgi:uncharacterized protein YprB with RNaseH-like and TPR domain
LAEPRIAFIDVETAPIDALVWTMFEANVIHVNEPTYLLCYAIKWVGQSRVTTRALCDYPGYARNKKSDKALLADLWADLDGADILVAHNGDSFDFKKINARLLVHGYKPPSPFKTVDTLKIARRHFKFDSNKLDNIGRYLQVGRKLPHTGKDLWLGCMRGDAKSWRTMRRYNAQDVHLLERVYEKLKPWASNHPALTTYTERPGCPVCSSTHTQQRGFNVAKTRKTPRLHCQDCGHWFTGSVKKNGTSNHARRIAGRL